MTEQRVEYWGDLRLSEDPHLDDRLELRSTTGLPGRLIVLDGMDGVGKTTTIEMVAGALGAQGRDVLVTCSPTKFARELPLYQSFLYEPQTRPRISYRALLGIITGDRLQHAHDTIWPALREGTDVLCDRYVPSALAHLNARGFDSEDWFYQMLQFLPRPQLTCVLTADLGTIISRVSAREGWRERFVEPEYMPQLHASYKLVAETFFFSLLDTTHGSPEATAAQVLDLLRVDLS